MYTAKDVADYLLSLSNPEIGDNITNLKLQKLCYYAQGFYLAINDGEKLFEDEIEAWQHGPVVPALYHEYKKCGSETITAPEQSAITHDSEDAAFLRDVFDSYGQFSAWKLRDMTHNEPPWIEASQTGSDKTISIESMQSYFSTLVTD